MNAKPHLLFPFCYLLLGLAIAANAQTSSFELLRGTWETNNSGYVASGTDHEARLRQSLGKGDFHLKASLTLATLEETVASFRFGGENLGFDGSGKTLFIESIKDRQPKRLGNAAKYITPGSPFLFEVRREGGLGTFLIDGKEIHRKEAWHTAVDPLQFRPWRNRMNIAALSLTGDVQDRTEPPGLALFSSGGDYHTVRIPALVRTKSDTLLAFCEGRVSRNDHGDIDILLRRSTDGGRSWGPVQVVHDNGHHQVGNPCPLVDLRTGKVFLLQCRSSHSESQVLNGNGSRDVFVSTSEDDGLTWSEAVDISAQVKRENWRWYATGPCSSIQIQTGPHAGRLVVPANHSVHPADTKRGWEYRCHSLISDDQGTTWQIGSVSEYGGSETQIAEVKPGLLVQDIRMQDHGIRRRAVRFSEDGGLSWGAIRHDPTRPDPICQGSVISVPGTSGLRTLYSSNPTGPGRTHMTLYRSVDAAKTWTPLKVLHTGPAAYSDLEVTGDNLFCLYEGGESDPYESIRLLSFPLNSFPPIDP